MTHSETSMVPGFGWGQVKFRSCGREFQCTPWDDYYNATSAEDGVCERCLIGDRKLVHVVRDRDGTLTEVPRPSTHSPGGVD